MGTLSSQVDNRLLLLTLDNTQHANAFGVDEAMALTKILKGLRRQPIDGVIFRASGRHFCSGGNLKYYAGLRTRAQGLLANQKIRSALGGLARLPIPTVALVDGDCFGGGLELLSCFDMKISSPRSFFGFWQRRIGLSFGWGGFARWADQIGAARVRQISLNAEHFSSYQALEWGLLDRIVPHQSLEDSARKWLTGVGRLGPEAGRLWKSLTPENEVHVFTKLWLNLSHKQALRQFAK